MRIAAFFDLDGTLLTVNSGALWLKRERRLGRITRWQVAQGMFYVLAYKLGAIDMEHATLKGLQTVAGEHEETVRQWTRQWFTDEVLPHVAPEAHSVLEQHRAAGHLLVLLTSSSLYASEMACDYFALDHFLCTRYEVRDGVFTGKMLLPLCYGPGKVQHAERFALEQELDLGRSYFYGDSLSDLPMLRRVGHPRVVNPDLRLRLAALRYGWPVLDWSGKPRST